MQNEGSLEPGSYLGGSAEKRVYRHPSKPDQVVGFYNEAYTMKPESLKASYYLNKLLGLLVPNTFPDVHQVATDSQMIVSDYIDIDHEKIKPPGEPYGNEYVDARRALGQRLREIGVVVDMKHDNFVFDKDGAFHYIDTPIAWGEDREEKDTWWLGPTYDEQKLISAINGLPQAERQVALKYFSRLQILKDEAIKKDII